MQGVQVCAHSIDQLEFFLAFIRDQNFENRTIFGRDRQLEYFFKNPKIPKMVLLEKVWPQIQLLLYKMDSKFAISKFAVIFQAPKIASLEDLVYFLLIQSCTWILFQDFQNWLCYCPEGQNDLNLVSQHINDSDLQMGFL